MIRNRSMNRVATALCLSAMLFSTVAVPPVTSFADPEVWDPQTGSWSPAGT